MPRRAARTDYHHGDLRAALITAATQLVRTHGAAGFSLREAARQVGVDAAAAYRHFNDKSELLLALAQGGFERLAKALDRATGALPAGAAADVVLAAMARAYVAFAIAHPADFRVMFGDSGTDARDPRLRTPDVKRTAYEQLEDAVGAWALAAGTELEVTAAARVCWSGVHGVARLVVDGALPLTEKDALALGERVTRALMVGLAAPATATKPRPRKRARS